MSRSQEKSPNKTEYEIKAEIKSEEKTKNISSSELRENREQ
jgi:hypothetical protein